MNLSILAAAACLVLWIVLAFVLSLPTGWVHVLLAGGIVLLGIGIVNTGAPEGDA